MNDKINQNPDFSLLESSWSESLKQRVEVQQNLKNQLQELKSLQEQVKQASDAEKADRNITDQLLSLEDRIQQMNAFKGEAFDLEVMKIQSQLNVLNVSLNDQVDLKNKIYASYSNLYANIKNKLPAHNPQTIAGRVDAANQVASIDPQNEKNLFAKVAAGIIKSILA